MKKFSDGVTRPKGFLANGIACGIKGRGKKDLALIYSTQNALAWGMFTNNKIKASSIKVTQSHLRDKRARAIIVNSGNANCFTGKTGLRDAGLVIDMVAKSLGIESGDVLIGSTGIIGKRLPVKKIRTGIPLLIQGLSRTGSDQANLAIMTTDRVKKTIAVSFKLGAKTVSIGAISKGAGMIYPDLSSSSKGRATMLCFITTDAKITTPALKSALDSAVNKSFNSISIDGCTSTNDMVLIMANGLAGNSLIKPKSKDFIRFQKALGEVCLELAKKIVRDAEGATKFIQIKINRARSKQDAKAIGFAIANSNLFKAACYGNDPNWGRIIAAIGSSDANIKPETLGIRFSSFKNRNIKICVNLNRGKESAVIYTSDLSPEYVRFNAEYG